MDDSRQEGMGGAAQPGAAQPGAARPGAVQPGAAQPGTLEDPGAGLREFLRAEAADDGEAAEAALRSLFAALPPVEPGAGFAGRVMARIAAAPRVLARAPADLPRPFRWPLAAALFLSGIAAFYLLPAALLLASRLEPGGVLKLTAEFWSAAGERLAALAWIHQAVGQLLGALFEVAATPTFLLGAVATAALVTLLARWLFLLLEPSRRISDAFSP